MFRRKIQSYQKQEHTWWIRKWLTASAGNWETSSNGLSTTFVSASTITTSSKGIWRTFWKRKNGKMISRSTRNGSTPISIQSQRRTLCALRTRAEPNGWEDVQLTALQSTSHDDDDDDDEFEKCESKKKKLHSSSVHDKIRVVYPPALMMNELLLGKALVHWKKRYKVIIDMLIPVQPCTRITCKWQGLSRRTRALLAYYLLYICLIFLNRSS